MAAAAQNSFQVSQRMNKMTIQGMMIRSDVCNSWTVPKRSQKSNSKGNQSWLELFLVISWTRSNLGYKFLNPCRRAQPTNLAAVSYKYSAECQNIESSRVQPSHRKRQRQFIAEQWLQSIEIILRVVSFAISVVVVVVQLTPSLVPSGTWWLII